ncbi:hypothetical protein MY5147_000264 [Beauveria neobassiana]|uniref:Secreted protein n=1 Tax=Beauveria bassiana TaxID=176275 RepID=A0A2S7XYK1_BEABA|nr:hypothetical protein BB8028_0001g09800 [Beauveria bassiana]
MLATILLQTLPLVPAVLAGTVKYPEVVPGPGLPSLESLGLTSEQLYTMEPASPDTEVNARASLAPMFTPICATDSGAYTDVNNLMACERYLARIGANECTVPSGFRKVRYCFAGDADVNGLSITGKSLTSTCASVAHALRWIINNCRRATKAAGSEAAFGNGDIIVTGVNRNFS